MRRGTSALSAASQSAARHQDRAAPPAGDAPDRRSMLVKVVKDAASALPLLDLRAHSIFGRLGGPGDDEARRRRDGARSTSTVTPAAPGNGAAGAGKSLRIAHLLGRMNASAFSQLAASMREERCGRYARQPSNQVSYRQWQRSGWAILESMDTAAAPFRSITIPSALPWRWDVARIGIEELGECRELSFFAVPRYAPERYKTNMRWCMRWRQDYQEIHASSQQLLSTGTTAVAGSDHVVFKCDGVLLVAAYVVPAPIPKIDFDRRCSAALIRRHCVRPSVHLIIIDMTSRFMFLQVYSSGLCSYGLHADGPYSCGLYMYGLYSYSQSFHVLTAHTAHCFDVGNSWAASRQRCGGVRIHARQHCGGRHCQNLAFTVMACIAMASIIMVYMGMAYIGMTYIGIANTYIVVAYMFMAYILMPA